MLVACSMDVHHNPTSKQEQQPWQFRSRLLLAASVLVACLSLAGSVLAQSASLTVLPGRTGNVYFAGECPRITVGPLSGVALSTTVTNVGTGKTLSPVTLESYGRYWYGYLPACSAGTYKINVTTYGVTLFSFTWYVVGSGSSCRRCRKWRILGTGDLSGDGFA